MALLSFPLAAAFAQSGKLTIAGTTVSLVPIKDFAPATGFAGLSNPATQASMLVTELPAVAYDQIAPKLATLDGAKLAFAPQRVDVQKLEQAEIAGQKAPLLSGKQMAGGTNFDKWIVLLKGARTVLITVQSPEDAKLDSAAVRAMLASITLGGEPSLADKLKALPFAITPAEPFRIIDTIAGSGVLMTVGPLDADPSGIQPMLIAAYQLSGASLGTDQLEATAETLLKRLPGFSSVTIASRDKVRMGGSDGVLLAGTYSDKGIDKRFEQYLAIGKAGRYLQVIVSADVENFDGLKPAIKAIVDSVAFADNK
ncbi:hypothetical protein DWF00_25275 [Bosea caraganae]|uniref:Uncharacterized protein n=1 Tax=Bosea caraganae TaxID=2763117 RepID=A0A370LAG6_9HYPH|nr:hypothetical protein [Bosea caraganae]RDJ21672.1 hypothetical protein DWF00_25275 [Bosea caraganae]RDJ28297.1 hypothetical protein DWE98_06880 [Bosea caraganae]